jgi:hypothetical protein
VALRDIVGAGDDRTFIAPKQIPTFRTIGDEWLRAKLVGHDTSTISSWHTHLSIFGQMHMLQSGPTLQAAELIGARPDRVSSPISVDVYARLKAKGATCLGELYEAAPDELHALLRPLDERGISFGLGPGNPTGLSHRDQRLDDRPDSRLAALKAPCTRATIFSHCSGRRKRFI